MNDSYTNPRPSPNRRMGLLRRVQQNLGGSAFRSVGAGEERPRRYQGEEEEVRLYGRVHHAHTNSRNVHYHESWLCWKDGVAGELESTF